MDEEDGGTLPTIDVVCNDDKDDDKEEEEDDGQKGEGEEDDKSISMDCCKQYSDVIYPVDAGRAYVDKSTGGDYKLFLPVEFTNESRRPQVLQIPFNRIRELLRYPGCEFMNRSTLENIVRNNVQTCEVIIPQFYRGETRFLVGVVVPEMCRLPSSFSPPSYDKNEDILVCVRRKGAAHSKRARVTGNGGEQEERGGRSIDDEEQTTIDFFEMDACLIRNAMMREDDPLIRKWERQRQACMSRYKRFGKKKRRSTTCESDVRGEDNGYNKEPREENGEKDRRKRRHVESSEGYYHNKDDDEDEEKESTKDDDKDEDKETSKKGDEGSRYVDEASKHNNERSKDDERSRHVDAPSEIKSRTNRRSKMFACSKGRVKLFFKVRAEPTHDGDNDKDRNKLLLLRRIVDLNTRCVELMRIICPWEKTDGAA